MTRAAAKKAPKLDVVPDILRGPADSPLCSECPLAVDGAPGKPVPGEGPSDPPWIVVGEGPGRNEVLMGRPFVGASGRLFMRVLDALNVERESIWITNATLCQPPYDKTKKLMEEARRCCKPRLETELAQFPGRPILALGAHGAQTLVGDKFKISEMASALQKADVDGTGERRIIATHHPARILRGGDGKSTRDRAVDLLFLDLLYDAGKVAALGRGADIEFSDDVEIAVHDPDEALRLYQKVYDDATALGHCAIDVETDGRDTGSARVCSLTAIAIATVNFGVSADYSSLSASTEAGRKAWALLRKLCADPDVSIVFHNRQYDELVLGRYGVFCVGSVHDTMLKHHSAYPGSSHRLQDVGTQFFAIPPWKAEFRKGDGTTEELCFYNARDTLVTARLDPLLDQHLDQTRSWRTYDKDNALAPIAMRMEQVGIPVDYARNRELHEGFQKIIREKRRQVEANANDPETFEKFVDKLAMTRALKARKADPADVLERHAIRFHELRYGQRQKKDPSKFLRGKEPVRFSIGNRDHVAAYLMARGHQLYRTTSTGKPSTKKDYLEELAHIEDVRDILAVQDAMYLDSHFAGGLPLEGSAKSGQMRLHSTWSIHKITGRWGSTPAVQNWPKANMRGRPNLRSQVIAPPGRKLVGADYAQLEARVIALLSGDPFLLRVFMEGFGECAAGCRPDMEPVKFCPQHDLHTVFAIEVFAGFLDMNKAERKELRDLIKRGEYGGFYGGSIETLYASIVKEFPHVKIADVAKIVQIIATKMPGVAAWHQTLIRQAMKGEIRSAFWGRRRTFPLGNADMTVVLNFPVQASGVEIVNDGILKLHPQLPPEAEIILHGHDAVMVECWEEDAEEIAKLMTESLSCTYEIAGKTMFFPANAAVGNSWTEV